MPERPIGSVLGSQRTQPGQARVTPSGSNGLEFLAPRPISLSFRSLPKLPLCRVRFIFQKAHLFGEPEEA